MYQQDIDDLKNKINIFIKNRDKNTYKINENEIKWHLSKFVSDLILISEKVCITASTIEKIIDEYNKANNKKIKLHNLKENCLVREVLDEVIIPKPIQSFCNKLYGDKSLQEKYYTEKLYDDCIFLGFFIKQNNTKFSIFRVKQSEFFDLYNKYKCFYIEILEESKIKQAFNFREVDKFFLFDIDDVRLSQNESGNIINYLFYKIVGNDLKNIDNIKKWVKVAYPFRAFESLKIDPEGTDLLINSFTELLQSENDLIMSDVKCEIKKYRLEDRFSGDFDDIVSKVIFDKYEEDYCINTENLFLLYITSKKALRYYRQNDICYNSREPIVQLIKFLANDNLYHGKKYFNDISNDVDFKPFLIFKGLELKNTSDLIDFFDNKNGLIFYCNFCDKFCSSYSIIKNEQDKTLFWMVLRQVTDLLFEQYFSKKENRRDLFYLQYYLIDNILQIFKYDAKAFELYEYCLSIIKKSFNENEFNYPSLTDIENTINILFVDERCGTLNNVEIIHIKFSKFFFLTQLINILQDQYSLSKKLCEIFIEEYNNFLGFSKEKADVEIDDGYQNFVQYIDWYNLTKCLDKYELLDKFLFSYNNMSDKSEFLFLRHKVLCHLNLLSKIYIEYDNVLDDKFCQNVAKVIVKIIEQYFIYTYEDKSFTDIFKFCDDREEFNKYIKTTFYTALNRFQKDEFNKVTDLFVESNNIYLLFEVYFNGCKYRELIEDKIRKCNVKAFDFIYDNEIIKLIENELNSHISNSLELAEITFNRAEEIAKDYKNRKINLNFVFNLENLRLGLFYKKNEKENIWNYQPYDYLSCYDNNKLYIAYLQSKRLFYYSLILFNEKKYEEAYKFMEASLKNREDDNKENLPWLLYIKFYKLSNDGNTEEISSLLSEVNKYLKEKSIINYQDLCILVKLCILNYLNKEEEIKKFFDSLDNTLKCNIDFAEQIIECLNRNKKYSEAFKKFQAIDEKYIECEEYKRLKSTIKSEEIENLKDAYKSIICLSGKQRFQVLPDKINEHKNNFEVFICNEFYKAIHNLLIKRDILNKIIDAKEDTITDLIILVLKGRLKLLDYDISDQGRGGKSYTGNEAGERDLIIAIDDDYEIIIEAVKTNCSKVMIEKHLKKVSGYTPDNKILFMLYYHLEKNFVEKTTNIKKIIQEYNFNDDRKFISFEDIDINNNNIKIYKSEHSNSNKIYHIFINFAYN